MRAWWQERGAESSNPWLCQTGLTEPPSLRTVLLHPTRLWLWVSCFTLTFGTRAPKLTHQPPEGTLEPRQALTHRKTPT